MTPAVLAAKRGRKEMQRRRLRAFKRRLQAQHGVQMGEHFYRLSRRARGRRKLVEQFLQRASPRRPTPRLVPLETPHHAKRGVLAHLFRKR